MSNGSTFSNLTTSLASGNFNNSGNRSSAVSLIVVHHNATTSKDVAINTWRTDSGYQGSAHYEITDNEIIGVLGEELYAWHANRANDISIGLEHVNSSTTGWTVSEATMLNGAKLAADICKRYGIKPSRDTIKGHGELTAYGNATACPGGIDMDKYVSYVLDYYNGTQQTTTATKTENNGGHTMYLIAHITGDSRFNGKALYLFDFNSQIIRGISSGDELSAIQEIYKANYGRDIPMRRYDKSAPWYHHLMVAFDLKIK